jgi:hypothetical protein
MPHMSVHFHHCMSPMLVLRYVGVEVRVNADTLPYRPPCRSSTVCPYRKFIHWSPCSTSTVFTIPGKVRACTCALYDNGGKGN